MRKCDEDGPWPRERSLDGLKGLFSVTIELLSNLSLNRPKPAVTHNAQHVFSRLQEGAQLQPRTIELRAAGAFTPV